MLGTDQTRGRPCILEGMHDRLEKLRAQRFAEDDRQVCMERARILQATRARHAHLSQTMRQAAILRDLCEQITVVIEPEDCIVGRMPEVVPSPEEERFIAENPQLFHEPGVPGWLDSMGIYVPEWGSLVQHGLGGLASQAQRRLGDIATDDPDADLRREFITAVSHALQAVSGLIRRYAQHACKRGMVEIADRCDRIAWDAPGNFVDALQLLQIVHMVLSCLVGGRDVTPGRMDQYLHALYKADIATGRLDPDEAAAFLAMFFLRLSQMAGSGTDFDDNVRRTPCKYTHLYVTVGGTTPTGESCINDLSYVILDAIRLLDYREPTLVVRHRPGGDARFSLAVAALIRDRLPVTVYNDEVVVRGLVSQGVPLEHARGYAHSACHNVLVVGQEAGSGPGGFHNLPYMLLLALNAGRDPLTGAQVGAATAEPEDIANSHQFWSAFEDQIRFALASARRSSENRWSRDLRNACPLLQSALMGYCYDRLEPCHRAAPISHLNHYLMGLATTVDSLLAIDSLVFESGDLSLDKFAEVLRADWEDHESLRRSIRARLPRYGQDSHQARELTARIGNLWVREVRRAARGMDRLVMWPGFYSHLVHAHAGGDTPATPDGRRRGEPLSENQAPSFGTRTAGPTAILRAMTALPFDQTASGAATLSLAAADIRGEAGLVRLIGLLDTYFRAGGLHLQINVLEPGLLERAIAHPEEHADLVVRVTGFSAYFTRLSPTVREDLMRRWSRDSGGA